MAYENPPVAAEGFAIPELSPSALLKANPSAPQFPPGLVGEVAEFIMAAAPRPVPEIAHAGAIGLLAGICGRTYNISGAGLNQYVILVADTGRGKEAIASGISKLMKAVKATVPSASEFEGPAEIASPQALIKWLSRTPCIYSIVGEFGLKLNEMSALHAPPHITGLKRSLLDLYNKSGHGALLGAMAYSKREENTPVVTSPSFTLIGESTPNTLFENLNEGIIANGLLPRFIVIEFVGKRPPPSATHADAIPSDVLITKLSSLCAHCASVSSSNRVSNVSISAAALPLFDQFNAFCDAQINDDNENSIGRELWNRAHLKALKLAALYAVGINPYGPDISAPIASRAIDEIYNQTISLRAKFTNGEVGAIETNETLRRNAVLTAMKHYAVSPYEAVSKYGVKYDLHSDRVIPKSYLSRRLGDTAAFRNAREGSTRALEQTLKNMLDADEIREISKKQMTEQYATTARAFAISNPKEVLDAK